jgi:hypothetical protein
MIGQMAERDVFFPAKFGICPPGRYRRFWIDSKYVKKMIALIFRAWTETGNNARRRSLNVESLILLASYRLAISSVRSNVTARLF